MLTISNAIVSRSGRAFASARQGLKTLRERLRSEGGVGWIVAGVRRRLRRRLTYIRALAHRRRLSGVTFVGITGSAGKTTTKDLAVLILSELAPCESTFLSENEHLYIAQTVLATRQGKHRFCVIEASGGSPGYLDRTIRLVKPHIAVITLVARDHFQAFKSIEGIAEEKAKLVRTLPPDGIAVLNIDDPHVRAIGESCGRRVIWIGQGEGANLRLREVRSVWPEPLSLLVEHEGRSYRVATQLHGDQLALSVLAALGVAIAAGVPMEKAIAALTKACPPEGRMQPVRCPNDVTFIRDDWKAPYWSLQAPLKFMRDARAARKLIVVGTLSDYSLSASKIYPKVAKQAAEVADIVVFVGPHALRALKDRRAAEEGRLLAFPAIRDAATYLQSALKPGDLVLLKGSNKADHLVRLLLDRTRFVGCWRERCQRAEFCDRCGELEKSIANRAPAGDASTSEPAGIDVRDGRSAPNEATTSVVVGLGNPGKRLRDTPHNIGYHVLDTVAAASGATWSEEPEGLIARIEVADKSVTLLKPAASMNNCGEPVRRFLDRLGLGARDCMVVHDDIDIALGDVRIKRRGGDAGHLGMRSVVSALGTGDVVRVRVGVRREGDIRRGKQVVLENFVDEDAPLRARSISRAVDLVREEVAAGEGAADPRTGSSPSHRSTSITDRGADARGRTHSSYLG